MLKQLTDQACVWMSAGLLRFWLCDRAFNCDDCPLDRALRAQRSTHRPSGSTSAQPTAGGRPDVPSGASTD